MRSIKLLTVAIIFVLAMTVLVQAGPNKFGVADSRNITFENPIRVGDVVLPKGEYKVLHTMDGDNHIMVFTQQGGKNPVEVKVKCTLVPLTAKPASDLRRPASALRPRPGREVRTVIGLFLASADG